MKITDREIVAMMVDESPKGIGVARTFWRDCYVASLSNAGEFNHRAADIADAALVEAVALGMIAGMEL